MPISSTLDTPGSMTRSGIDSAIMLHAMAGDDATDPASKNLNAPTINYSSGISDIKNVSGFLKKKRLGFY